MQLNWLSLPDSTPYGDFLSDYFSFDWSDCSFGCLYTGMVKKLKLDDKDLDYHQPSENSIKNFKLDVNLQTENDSKNLDQLNLPIQEEGDNQLNLFEESGINVADEQNIEQKILPNEIVYKLFIRPKFDVVFPGSKIRQILESKGMQVEQLPVFCKKLLIKEESIVVNVADMYEPGIVDLNTIDSSYFRGLVIFATMGTPRTENCCRCFSSSLMK